MVLQAIKKNFRCAEAFLLRTGRFFIVLFCFFQKYSLCTDVDSYAMLMTPNKGKTAVRGCHCPGDMAVRMREVLARPWVGVCLPLALSLSYPGVCCILEFLKGKPGRRL